MPSASVMVAASQPTEVSSRIRLTHWVCLTGARGSNCHEAVTHSWTSVPPTVKQEDSSPTKGHRFPVSGATRAVAVSEVGRHFTREATGVFVTCSKICSFVSIFLTMAFPV